MLRDEGQELDGHREEIASGLVGEGDGDQKTKQDACERRYIDSHLHLELEAINIQNNNSEFRELVQIRTATCDIKRVLRSSCSYAICGPTSASVKGPCPFPLFKQGVADGPISNGHSSK